MSLSIKVVIAFPLCSKWIIAHGQLASRPLWRITQKFVREPLTDYLLKKNPATGTTIRVDVEGEKLKMEEG
jgi:ATP-dependent Clp protease ATP-binding subunit ClpA